MLEISSSLNQVELEIFVQGNGLLCQVNLFNWCYIQFINENFLRRFVVHASPWEVSLLFYWRIRLFLAAPLYRLEKAVMEQAPLEGDHSLPA